MEEIKYIPGDLVRIKKAAIQSAGGNIFKVIAALGGSVYKVIELNDGSKDYIVNNNCIHPIKITKNIFEDNGWEKWYKCEFMYQISLKDDDEDSCLYIAESMCEYNLFFMYAGDSEHAGNRIGSIRYVHQLQHLLFGLGLNHEIKV